MYVSKTGTERETDLQRIKGKKMAAPKPRVEETIIMKRKKKEYLDNYQYHETKQLRRKQPAVVIHERLGAPVGGTIEEVSYQKIRTGTRSAEPGSRTTTTRTEKKQTTSNLRNRPKPQANATNYKSETTRIGRRSGPSAGETKFSTKTTTRTTTTRRGEPKTQTQTKTITTRSRRSI